MGAPVTVASYAKSRGKSPATVRRWLRNGAPCVTSGSHGPGQSATVDPGALDAWRGIVETPRTQILDQVARGLLDTLVRDGPEGFPVHRSIGLQRKPAAALLAFAFERIARTVLGRDLEDDELPPEIVQICTICQTAGSHFTKDEQ